MLSTPCQVKMCCYVTLSDFESEVLNCIRYRLTPIIDMLCFSDPLSEVNV